jgi:hypothetical protein
MTTIQHDPAAHRFTTTEEGWEAVREYRFVCSYAAAFLRRNPSTEQHRHVDALLDEALDESFPASDPPSVGAST